MHYTAKVPLHQPPATLLANVPVAFVPSTWSSNLFTSEELGPSTGQAAPYPYYGPWERLASGVAVAGTALGAYHGYKRTESVGWAIGWALLGGLFPFITIPVAIAQGFGKPEPAFTRGR